MFVIIDPENPTEIAVAVGDENTFATYAFPAAPEAALLTAFDASLKKADLRTEEVRGIAVVVGRGRFTATRLAVTLANSLAYAWGIPVVAVPEFDPPAAFQKLSVAAPGTFVLPVYSAEARIGQSGTKKKKTTP